MKKLVEAVMYDKSGKMLFAYVLKTSTIKNFAGIKRIADLEDDCYAQAQLESSIVDAMTSYAKAYTDSHIASVDHIIIFNDYANTAEKYSIR